MKVFDDELVIGRRARPSTNRHFDREQLGSALDFRGGTGRPLGRHQVLALQRTAGNAAVAQLLAGEERESPVRNLIGRGGGQPLPLAVQADMEGKFGEDFSDVRIHTGAEAANSATAVNAKAYTVGHEIVFGSDSPALDSAAGKRTLAHELTHVVQQRSGPVEGTEAPGGIQISDPSDRFETQAEQIADAVEAGGTRTADLGSAAAPAASAAPLQRDEDEDEDDDALSIQRDEDEDDDDLSIQRVAAENEEEEFEKKLADA